MQTQEADNATVTHTHKFLPSTDSPRNVSENKQLEQKHTKLSNYHKKERLKKREKKKENVSQLFITFKQTNPRTLITLNSATSLRHSEMQSINVDEQ